MVPDQPGESPWISVYVCNTGPGISAHDLPHIFDRFYQRSADPTQPVAETGGTGIGLSLVRELLMLMHGGLAVRSRPGEGAEFAIRLRQTRQSPMALTPNAEPVSPQLNEKGIKEDYFHFCPAGMAPPPWPRLALQTVNTVQQSGAIENGSVVEQSNA